MTTRISDEQLAADLAWIELLSSEGESLAVITAPYLRELQEARAALGDAAVVIERMANGASRAEWAPASSRRLTATKRTGAS